MRCFISCCFGVSKSKLFKRHRNNSLVAAADTQHQEEHGEDKQTLQIYQLITQSNREESIIFPIVDSIEKPLDCSSEKQVSEEEFTFPDVLSVQNNESRVNEGTPEVDRYPADHRYLNCGNNGDELDVSGGYSASEGHCNYDNLLVLEDTSSESLFSLSIDSRKIGCQANDPGEKEVTSPAPKSVLIIDQEHHEESNGNDGVPSQNVDSVSENTTQREPSPLKEQDKENVSVQPGSKVFTHNNTSRLNDCNEKLVDREISVDTSLSSWLVKSEATCSPSSGGNSATRSANSSRMILGELSVEKVKQQSASPSPRLLRKNRCPDKRLISGTVGSYWNHTQQAMDSD
ncbi:hypothetical protein ACFE04_023815 [Oxalis oulophora]